ncbi:dihydrodipicolinate synthase family protein [Plantibacter flavus]|uniref:dihydrodipicolinate synthase family protein n=1 Tax=Plantibacter flavus TaxID=150123 RepID=UPI003F14C509
MFTGVSAFPLTPIVGEAIDEDSFARIVERAARAGVDSIGALGSTGSAAYLDRAERARVARLAVEAAGDIPVIVGISALATRAVLANLDDACAAGAAAVLLAPMTYQALGDDEVFGLYEAVATRSPLPIVVYDNPGTTHVVFSDELHARIAHLDAVASIKIPPVSVDLDTARVRVAALRALLPDGVTVGVSGDGTGAIGLLAGSDAWYSVIAGVIPEIAVQITRAAQAGDTDSALRRSDRLAPIWGLFGRFGSLRVASAIAEELGLVGAHHLPRPVLGLDAAGRAEVVAALDAAGLRP